MIPEQLVSLSEPIETDRTIRAEMLQGHRGRIENALWGRWIEAAAHLTNRWWCDLEDDPFAYNETASVSHLCSAATASGLLGLAEYASVKKWSGNRRYSAGGRCDLWLSDSSRSWAFEFKQLCCDRYNLGALAASMDAARACARCVRESEADLRVAGLVASMWWQDPAALQSARSTMRTFARDRDYAWRIGAEGVEEPETYVFFDIVCR
ncbi:hypothetical protein [Sphingomonas phyllosphaerae]|uniref:hypothetical protein n=1 Tax=Sphingomonas phyllosphaerae TaxID=257003 RepID=UPI002413CA4F|nr:hypothetical protein [Sphingomonas phyllosphaerae]